MAWIRSLGALEVVHLAGIPLVEPLPDEVSPGDRLGRRHGGAVKAEVRGTPMGSIDHPINPLCIAIASEATFVARTLDTDPKHMSYIIERAMNHKGTSFIEIYQNCIIFNDKAFGNVIGRENRADRMVYLEDGKPLTFGPKKDKAIRLTGLQSEIVNINEVDEKELLIHRESDPEPNYAYLLTQMVHPEMPMNRAHL